jgi:uncharacterized protein YbjT (DUF2867 family)
VILRVLVEADHEGEIYELTGPEPFTFSEAAETLSAVAGGPITYRPASPDQYKAQLLSYGVPEWMCDALNELYAQYRAGAGLKTTDAIRRLIHQAPHSFSSFARDHAEAFRIA